MLTLRRDIWPQAVIVGQRTVAITNGYSGCEKELVVPLPTSLEGLTANGPVGSKLVVFDR